MYLQNIRQPHFKELKNKGYLRVCGKGEFSIFPLLKMRSQNTSLRRSKARFQQKLKTKLNKSYFTPKVIQTSFRPVFIICSTCFENMKSNNGLNYSYKERLKLTLVHICNSLKRLQN